MKAKKLVVTPASKSTSKPPVPVPPVSVAAAKARSPKPHAASAPAEKPAPKAGVNTGKSGMRVMAFQDWSFKVNDDPKRRLTDEELAELWKEEFPQSRAVLAGRITADMVRAVRRLYNEGTGGHGTPGVRHDTRPYVMDKGKRVVSEYTRTRKAPAAETEAAAPTQKAVAPKGKGKAPAAPVGRKPKAA